MNLISRSASIVAAAVGFAATSVLAEPVDRAELEALRDEVRGLEEQLERMKQRLEAAEAETAAAANSKRATPAPASAATLAVNDKGVTLASGDGANAIKLRGLVQLDARLYLNDAGTANDTFVLRRARLITEGTFARNYGYQLVTEFGGSSVSMLDANLTVAWSPAAQLKFGKFKVPVGLERLQSDSWTFFNERSIATNLTPDRDVGLQISGDVAAGTVRYAMGVFGGVADAASTANSDFDRGKDFAARVLVAPFRGRSRPLPGLSFGVGGSVGRQKTASGRTAGYKTDGQRTFFSYNSSVVADGTTWRVAPQVDYRHGPVGVVGEYIVSAVNVRPAPGASKTELRNQAWQVAVGCVLTGEASAYDGVVPATNFDWAAGPWGAVEVVARYADLRIDAAAFPVFAVPATNAQDARAAGVGINWYLSKVVRFSFDFYQTDFESNAASPTVPSTPFVHPDELAFVSRFQLAF